jgi:hypothetical protein
MASTQYYDFIASIWSQLSEKDRLRMAELWKGMEQSVAAIYQKNFSQSYNANINDQFLYSDERWLLHKFDSSNYVNKAATYKSKEDLSQGIDLTYKHLIKVSWDNKSPVEISLRGFTPSSTRIDEIVTKINYTTGTRLVKKDANGALLEFTSPTVGIESSLTFHPTSIPSEDASEVVLSLLPEDLPISYPEYRYCYLSEYPRLSSIPTLQDVVRDESSPTILTEGVDYTVANGEICFKEIPPATLWGKRNLFNDEWPWSNYGFLIDIYQENSERYLEIVKGLWFAFWTGPKPSNLRRSLYLLFGLPTAPFAGRVVSVSSTQIAVQSNSGEKRVFDIPTELVSIVIAGQEVKQFDPLVNGIDVFDKVNYPGFLEQEVGRYGIRRFLLDGASYGTGPDTDETKALRMLEEYTFLPQIDVNAFIRPDINLANVRLFLDAIKPVIKTYLFQVIVGTFKDELAFEEKGFFDVDMDVSPNVDMNETTRQPWSILEAHELTVNPGLCVDSEGSLFEERIEIEVRDSVGLIDIFEV